MDGLPLDITDLSGWGVVAIFVVMLLTGRGIATRREVDDAKALAETFKDAWTAERARNDERDGQFTELLESSRTTARAVDVIYERAMGGDST